MKHAHYYRITGTIFLAAGLLVRYWVGKRRFYRRNFAGQQRFTSYGKAVATTFFERILRFFGMIFILLAVLMLIFGLL